MRGNKTWIDNVYRVRGTDPTRLDELRLDKNERTTKFSDFFFNRIVSKLRHEHLTAYPETEPLYDKLAYALKVNRDQIVLTAGSDAGIKNCFELSVERGSEVITISPTFAMVDIYAQLYGVKQIKIGYNVDLSFQYEKLLNAISQDTSLIVIANPNSPTGTLISNEDIESIVNKAQRCGAVVLVDEAYYGFCKQTALSLISKYNNLVVARTFSKAFGLAGCRVGYLVAQPELAQRLYRFRPMYEVNAFGVLAATEIMDNPEVMEDYLKETVQGREYIKRSLDALGYRYIDTNTNFIHIDFGTKRDEVEKLLIENKILVRGGPGVTGYESYLRITLGPEESMVAVVNALNDYLLMHSNIQSID
jgi:histidinol-phosphate aminotransferase